MSGEAEYRRLVEKIASEKGLRPEEVEEMVESRIDEFGGIINRDAAALMVAKSLGVEVDAGYTDVVHSLKLSDLVAGFQGIDVEGIVIERTPPRTSSRGELFARLVIADDTAAVPLIGWGEPAGKLADIELGDVIAALKVSVRRRGEGVEVFLTDRSSIRRLGKADPQNLWSLAEKFSARTIVLECGGASCGEETCCLYGRTPRGDPVQLLVPWKTDVEGYRGRIVAASRVTLREGGFLYARLYRGGVLDVVGEGGEVGVDSLFTASGVVVGYIVFRERGGRVYVADGESVRGLAVFSDSLFSVFAGLLGSEVEVLGVRRGARGDVLSDCASVTSKGVFRPSYAQSRILGSHGWVEVDATLLDASVYYRCSGERVYVSLRGLVDDGTGRARFIASGEEALGVLLGLEASDLCGYEEVGSIIEYSLDEARGGDYLFRGLLDAEGVFYVLEVSER